jgi:hypothetical protein
LLPFTVDQLRAMSHAALRVLMSPVEDTPVAPETKVPK